MANKNAEFLQKTLYGGMYNPALGYFKKPPLKKTNKNDIQISKAYNNPNKALVTNEKLDLSSLLKNYATSLSSGGGGGASAGSKIDLTPYINALKEGAAANKKTISDTYSAQRNQVTQALKAYQENTERARELQANAFNSSRADLEEQAYMNTRAAQQSAAARGLGGSGLQQLAQLSSQIENSKQTSDLAQKNTNSQEELTKALKDYENQANTQINDLTTEERNKITEIDANVAQAIANKQYEEDVRYQEALQQAAAANASIAASKANSNQELMDALANGNNALDSIVKNGIQNLQKVFTGSDYYNKARSKKNAKTLTNDLYSTYNKALESLQDVYANGGLGVNGSSLYNYYANQLSRTYNVLGQNLGITR